MHLSRRAVLAGVGSVGVTSVSAGCLGTDDDSDDRTFPGEADATDFEGTPDGPVPDSDVPDPIHEHLQTANGYDGSVTERVGEETVIVSVGAGAEGTAFAPVAIRVETETTVRWTWSGAGGDHDVATTAESATEFDSGDPVETAGTEFSYTFEQPGRTLYWCTPHRTAGMRGAVDVVSD